MSAGPSSADPATRRMREARSVLERGLRAGDDLRTEDVLAHYPDLADSSDAFLELAYSEFVLREQLGQHPTPDDWFARFPRWATDLRQLFDVHFEYKGDGGDELEPIFHPDFEIIEEVGRGGMGVVYRARQKSLNRVVALKVVLSGELASPKERARFRTEAEAAARLQHPNIVQVFEVGEADNRPFCAMEYVGGGTLAARIDGPWAAQPAAELVAVVARAVQHAHDNGIVHRDLKPANVLLSGVRSQESGVSKANTLSAATVPDSRLLTPDSCPLVPKVTDFGLAKCLTNSNQGPTRTGDLLGTPAYMSPEQAVGSKLVGPPTDVWALGVVLYELLTGRPPFQGESAVETLRQVQHAEPVPPRRLRPKLSRDIETICSKCLRKNPSHRYTSAAALAEDLERWLRGEPIAARPVGLVGRTRRWCARNPWVAALGGLVFVLVGVAAWLGVVTVLQLDEARRQANVIAQQERVARVIEEAGRRSEADGRAGERRRVVRLLVADGQRHLDDGDPSGAALWFAAALEAEPDAAAADFHRVRLGTALRAVPVLVASHHHASPVTADGPLDALGRPLTFRPSLEPTEDLRLSADGATVFACEGDLVAYDALTGKRTSAPIPTPAEPRSRGFVTDHITSNGKAVVSVRGGRLLAWDAATGTPLAVPLPPGYGTLSSVFRPDGSRYFGFAPVGNQINLYSAAGDVVAGPVGTFHASSVWAFTPDGTWLAGGTTDGKVQLWNADTGAVGKALDHGARVVRLVFNADGTRMVSAGADNAAQVWNLADGTPVGHRLPHGEPLTGVAVAPTGDRVITFGAGQTARVWDVGTGRLIGVPLHHPDGITGAAFHPKGKAVVLRGKDLTARVWDADTGVPLTPQLWHTDALLAAQFTADGRHVVAVSKDGGVRVWEVPAPRPAVPHVGGVHYGVWTVDGKTAVTGSGGEVAAWDADTGRVLRTFTFPGTIRALAVRPDGRRVAAASLTAGYVWDLETGERVGAEVRHAKLMTGAAFAPGGALATSGMDGIVRTWDDAGAETSATIADPVGVQSFAFAPHGQRLLTVGSTTRLWDVVGGENLMTEQGRDRVSAAMSADGSAVVTVSKTGKLRVYEGRGGQKTTEIDVGRWTKALAVGPDGTRAATTAEGEHAVQVWDLTAGGPLGAPLRHRTPRRFEFSPCGRFVATVGDGVRVWEVETGSAAAPPLVHGPTASFARFSPDGRRLLTGSFDKTARVWELAPDARSLADIVAHARALSARRMDARGVPVRLTPAEEAAAFRRHAAGGAAVW